MKILLLYATKKGATQMVSEQIAEEVSTKAFAVQDFKDSLDAYDTILIGTCMYAGRVPKELKEFCQQHAQVLRKKKRYIFVCGLLKEEATIQKELEENLGVDVIDALQGVYGIGGLLDMKKLNFMERKIIVMVNKKIHLAEKVDKQGYYDMLDKQMIQKLINDVQKDMSM